jgi:hypothetical protein
MATTAPVQTPSAASQIGSAARKIGQALQPLQRATATNVQARSSGGGGDNSQQAANAQNQVNRLKILGSMRKGGKVKRTGVYLLHKNEVVKPARKKAKKREKKRARGR